MTATQTIIEELVKSRHCVKTYGEVFTPRHMVDRMLDLVRTIRQAPVGHLGQAERVAVEAYGRVEVVDGQGDPELLDGDLGIGHGVDRGASGAPEVKTLPGPMWKLPITVTPSCA